MTLRPLRPEDRDIEFAFVSNLSPDTRHNRLIGGARAITREYIESLVSVDYSRDMALAATTMLGGGETLIGVARYVKDKDGDSAEVAFVKVAPDLSLAGFGALAATAEGSDDGCTVSCTDWYGNARPIFFRGRTFALLGYELVEGTQTPDGVLEASRLRFLSDARN